MLSLFKKNKIIVRGFSLVEMTVVIAIFLIITGIIVANYPQFRDQSALELMAQEMAVNIRTAQVLGTGARVVGGQSKVEAKPYGIHFDSSEPNTFTSFIDSGNGVPDVFDPTDKKEVYVLQGADIIEFFINNQTTPESGVFDITYRRPNPEAKIIKDRNPDFDINELVIKIKGRRGDRCKQIRISANGQIAVIPGFDCSQENENI